MAGFHEPVFLQGCFLGPQFELRGFYRIPIGHEKEKKSLQPRPWATHLQNYFMAGQPTPPLTYPPQK